MDIFQAATGVSLWNAITFMLLGGIVFAGIQFLTGRKATKEHDATDKMVEDALLALTIDHWYEFAERDPQGLAQAFRALVLTGRMEETPGTFIAEDGGIYPKGLLNLPDDEIDAEFRNRVREANAHFIAEREYWLKTHHPSD